MNFKESFDVKVLRWSGFVMAGFLALAFVVGGGDLDDASAHDRIVLTAPAGKGAPAAEKAAEPRLLDVNKAGG